jgi:hypothetical protein
VNFISRLSQVVFAASPSILAAQTAAPPPAAQQIAAAVQALPADMREGAAVLGYKSGARLEVLRPGTNGMRCLALYVVRPDFHVACYHDTLEPFMLRGRDLRDGGMTSARQVDSVRFAEIESGKLKMPPQAMLYTLTGKKEVFNAATGAITGAQPLAVLYIPFATTATTGLSSSGRGGSPFLMNAGTAKAHVMIVGSMGQ